MAILFIFSFFILIKIGNFQSLTNTIHKTSAAAEKINDLWCYHCDSMVNGDDCVELTGNHSSLVKKCKSDEFICMVKRFSYTTSTENATQPQRMWSLERKCTNVCEAGCIVIGERTKLYACTSCCENHSLCNIGKGSASTLNHVPFLLFYSIITNTLLLTILKYFY